MNKNIVKSLLITLLYTVLTFGQLSDYVGTDKGKWYIGRDTTSQLFIGVPPSDNTVSPTDTNRLAFMVFNGGQLGSKTFIPSLSSGSGWRISYNNGRYTATFDNINIRGKLTIYDTTNVLTLGTVTSGVWHGTPINAPYINYNTTNFYSSSGALTSNQINASSASNGFQISAVNLGGTFLLATPQDLRTTASPTFANVNGNASSATKLQTARTIAGVSFDGSANISIPFANLSSIPTTVSGYGITDGITLTGSQTLTNKTIVAGNNTISGLTNSNLSGTAGITNANLANSGITASTSSNGFQIGAVSLGGQFTLTTPQDLQTTASPTFAKVNSLTLTSQTSGFTISGGTTSHTLTVNSDLSSTTSISLTGTANRVSVSGSTTLSNGGSVGTIDISSSYVGQTSITTLGTIGTGVWNGTAITDTYISSASNWNDAYNKRVSTWNLPLTYSGNAVTFNYNTTNFGLSGNNLVSNQINASTATNGFQISAVNLGGTFSLTTPQDLRTSASPTFNQFTLSTAGTTTSNAVRADRSLTMTGTTNQVNISAGSQDLTANRTWTFSLPQNIHTGATPTFAGMTLTGSLAMGSNTITSGLINGQNISSTANFTGTLTTTGNIVSTAGSLTAIDTYLSQSTLTQNGTMQTVFDINPYQQLRLFRNTNSASAYLYIMKGDGTSTSLLGMQPSTGNLVSAGNLQGANITPTNLTTGFLPYKSSSFLINSNIYTNGTNTGIGTTSLAEILSVGGNINQSANSLYYSTGYASGWGNTGFGLSTNSSGVSNLVVDNLTVRKTMSVYELLIRQIRATNGNLFISAGAKVTASSGTSVTFDDETAQGVTPFAVGDIVVSQKYNPNGATSLSYSIGTITVLNGLTATVSYDASSANNFNVGDAAVRIGSTSDLTRQGSIYLASDDDSSPFIDIRDGVNSVANWNSTATKVRIGKLSGMTSTTYGQLNGYGLWGQNAYLEGNVNIAGTLTAGDVSGYGKTFYAGKINKNLTTYSDGYFTNQRWLTNSWGTIQTFTYPSETDPWGGTNSVNRITVTSGTVSYANVPCYGNSQVPLAQKSTSFTLSFWARANTTKTFSLMTCDNGYTNYVTISASPYNFDHTLTTSWKRFSFTGFNFSQVSSGCNILFSTNGNSVGDWAEFTGCQLEYGSTLSSYQPTDGTISASTAYGMWASTGGFGGTIQNPVVSLNDYGLSVQNAGHSTTLANNSIMIGNITGTDTSAIKITNTGMTSTSGLFGYSSTGSESFALRLNGTASIAGTSFDATHIYNSGWALYSDGHGSLANGNITWTTGGAVTIASSVSITSSQVSGLGSLATMNSVAWGSNITGIPSGLQTPSTAGLYLSSTNLGYYNGTSWTSYIKSDGSGSFAGGHITWDASGNATYTGSISLTNTIPNTSVTGLGTLSTKSSVAWGTDLTGIPAGLTTPSASGLYLSSSYLGYYGSGIGWTSYIKSDGSGSLANGNISWTTGGTLSISNYLAAGSAASDINNYSTTINGNKLTTGTVIADSIRSTYLYSKTMVGGTISIGSGNSIFKADANGIYLGNSAFASAPFSVSPSGALVANNASITGSINSGSTITGATIIGGVFQTATSGQRIVVDGTNYLSFYNNSGDYSKLVNASVGTLELFSNIIGDTKLYIANAPSDTMYSQLGQNKLFCFSSTCGSIGMGIYGSQEGITFANPANYRVNLYQKSNITLATDQTFSAQYYLSNSSIGTAGYVLRSNGTNGYLGAQLSYSDLAGSGSSSLTTLGTITTGAWNGTVIDVAYGGLAHSGTAPTWTTSSQYGGILCGDNNGNPFVLSGNSTTTPKFLCSTGNGSNAVVPVWTAGYLTSILGAKSATIGTVGSTAIYTRTLTINGTTVHVVTTD